MGAAAVPPYSVLPPRKKDNLPVVIVLVVVLVVAVPVVGAAILYVMVSGLIQGPNPTSRPTMSLTVSSLSASDAILQVTGSQPPPVPGNLRVNLAVDSTFGTPTGLSGSGSTADVYVTGYTFPFGIVWNDIGGDGLVSTGDVLTVTYPPSLQAGAGLQFYLLWYDGSAIATLSWSA